MSAKFYIYRNLHTGGFSVKYKGIVIDRQQNLMGLDVKFKVNEKARQRVIKEKRKNVHAYVVCSEYFSLFKKINIDKLKIISYNPYLSSNFTVKGKKIINANSVIFQNGKCYLFK